MKTNRYSKGIALARGLTACLLFVILAGAWGCSSGDFWIAGDSGTDGGDAAAQPDADGRDLADDGGQGESPGDVTPPDAAAEDLPQGDAPEDTGGAEDLPAEVPADVPAEPLPHCDRSGSPDCSPHPGDCPVGGDPPSLFAGEVNGAIEAVLADHPDWFDYTSGFPCCPLALRPNDYVLTVVANVGATGLCCIRDPNDGNEIVVKYNQECAENFNILTSGSIVRHPPKYQGACYPAWF